MNEHCLEVKGLTFGYDNKNLLENMNITMDDGFISILGPNGSGKSTLLKLITGLLPKKKGQIYINGEKLEDISANAKAKLFTVINQKQSFPFPFNATELVALGRYPYRKNLNALSEEDYKIVYDAMESTNIMQFKDKLITDISGGEQQRVMLASALSQDTKIIFLDEAFSALDIKHVGEMVKVLKKRIKEKNIMVISIMHDLNVAYRYSDKVLLLENGNIVDYGSPKEVMTEEQICGLFDADLELIEDKGFFINI